MNGTECEWIQRVEWTRSRVFLEKMREKLIIKFGQRPLGPICSQSSATSSSSMSSAALTSPGSIAGFLFRPSVGRLLAQKIASLLACWLAGLLACLLPWSFGWLSWSQTCHRMNHLSPSLFSCCVFKRVGRRLSLIREYYSINANQFGMKTVATAPDMDDEFRWRRGTLCLLLSAFPSENR